MTDALLQRLRNGDRSALAGTDLLIRLPVSQELLNLLLATQTPPPVRELRLELGADNRARLFLEVDAPVVGLTRRELLLRIEGDLQPGRQDILDFRILDGLKLFDRPIIKLAHGMITEKLPAGVDLNSKRLRIDVSRLATALGYGYLLPLVNAARVESHPGQLQLLLHLQAQTDH